MTEKPKYVLLEGIELGNLFFSDFVEGEDPTLLANGEVGYTILGYANSIPEAQMKLYGTVYNQD